MTNEVTDKRYILDEPLVVIPLAMFDALLDIQNGYREEAVAEASRAEEAEQRLMELSGELADYQDTDGYLLNCNRNQRNAIDKLARQLAQADERCDSLEGEVEKYKALAVAAFTTLSEQYCVSYQYGGGCREIGKCSACGCPDIER